MTLVWPANTTLMVPPQAHINSELSLRAGIFPINTVGEPGAQGVVVTGMQGMGVSTPNAALVAAATEGFDSELHIPNGRIFLKGMLSMMVAAGVGAITIFSGVTIMEDGATPKLH